LTRAISRYCGYIYTHIASIGRYDPIFVIEEA